MQCLCVRAWRCPVLPQKPQGHRRGLQKAAPAAATSSSLRLLHLEQFTEPVMALARLSTGFSRVPYLFSRIHLELPSAAQEWPNS